MTMKHGTRAGQPDLVVHFAHAGGDDTQSGGDAPRVGLVVPKSVGTAVDRHRVARRLRHVARAAIGDLGGFDLVVIRALPGSRTAPSARLEQQLRDGLRRAAQRAGAKP